jgi:hypothetical protein
VNDPNWSFATANYRIAKGLFDHLIGAGAHCSRDTEAESFGGLETRSLLAFKASRATSSIAAGQCERHMPRKSTLALRCAVL